MHRPDLLPPAEPNRREITELLHRWQAGDPRAEERLVVMVYPLLRTMAGRYLGAGGHTRDATELAHDAYLRLFRSTSPVDCQDRQHFQAIAARVVRSLVVDYLRARSTAKRGGGGAKVPAAELDLPAAERPLDWLELDAALGELEVIDPAATRVVELRFFGGLTAEEISQVCSISSATVSRRWRFARAWLRQRLCQQVGA